jgi:hypothetical protein
LRIALRWQMKMRERMSITTDERRGTWCSSQHARRLVGDVWF